MYEREMIKDFLTSSNNNIGRGLMVSKQLNIGLAESSSFFRWIHFVHNYTGDPTINFIKEFDPTTPTPTIPPTGTPTVTPT